MWSIEISYVAALLAIGLIQYFVHRWRNPESGNGRLPPGSMGLPLIGETLQLFSLSKSIDIHPFFKTRMKKYGKIFKTSLAGRPMVVSMNPEFNHYIMQQEGKMVEAWYLDAFSKLLDVRGMGRDGEPAPLSSIGHIHKCFRNLVLTQVGSAALQEKVLPHIEETCRKTLVDWSNRDTIELKKELASVIFEFTAKHLYGFEPDKNLIETFSGISQGLLSFPINIPGTQFNKCMNNQKSCLKLMKDLLAKRQAMPQKRTGDLIDQIIDMMKTEDFMTHNFAMFSMLVVLFASFETISSTLSVALMLLTEHPAVVEELEKEHEEIISKRKNKEAKVTWKEYRSMNFTMQVINESLRMASVAPGIFRRAIKDIQVDGYTIPKGWTIVAVTSGLHLNPDGYKDPLSFNPWRWKDIAPSVAAKYFIPFGGGGRMCSGSDFTKTFMAVFLHTLVSHYRFEKVKDWDVTRTIFLGFGDGFYIKTCKKDRMQDI